MKTGAKAIFLDIDGTLLHNDSLPPDARDIAALRRAREKGHKVFINTGRSLAFLPEQIRSADYFDGFLCGCGTHFVHADGRTAFGKRVPADALNETLAYYLHTGKRCVYEGEEALYATFAARYALPLRRADDFIRLYPGAPVTKLTVLGGPDTIEKEELALLGKWFKPIRMPTYIEVILHGCGKGAGLRRVCELFGIPCENSVAIGDSENDLDMLRAAGTGVAMGNACEALKAAADDITLACGQAGVGAAVRRLVLGEERETA